MAQVAFPDAAETVEAFATLRAQYFEFDAPVFLLALNTNAGPRQT